MHTIILGIVLRVDRAKAWAEPAAHNKLAAAEAVEHTLPLLVHISPVERTHVVVAVVVVDMKLFE